MSDIADATWTLALLFALLLGSLAGWGVQRIAMIIQLNGDWPHTPQHKRFAHSASGMLAAFIVGAGTWISFGTPQELEVFTRLTLGMWIAQCLAAWGGAELVQKFYRDKHMRDDDA